MGKGFDFHIDEAAVRRVAQEAFDHKVDVEGVEMECPGCGHPFVVSTGDNVCPSCGFHVNVNKGKLK